MGFSPFRRRLRQLPALFLGLTLALTPIAASALPRSGRDLVPGVSAPSPLEKAGDPAEAYRAARESLSSLGLEREEIRLLWARMGDQLVPRLESGQLSPAALDFLSLPCCREDRLDRCLACAQAHPELEPEDVVLWVNMDLDLDFYAQIREIPDPEETGVLVNKYNALSPDYVPELTALEPVYGSGSLTPEAALAFVQMADAARADGISLHSVSAYRSYDTQAAIYQRNVSQGGPFWADTFSARPGHSEHQTGLALDINTARTSAHFENSPEYAWLQANCARYGFLLRYPQDKQAVTGYRFEPWHYRYVGEETARVCMEEGMTYEEYLARTPAPLANGVPALYLEGEALEADTLMLEGTVYLSAAQLAAPLGWSAHREGTLLVLTRGERTLTFQPGRSCLWDGTFHRLSVPAVELEDGLYLPLSDLCAALGLEVRETGAGLELSLPSQTGLSPAP